MTIPCLTFQELKDFLKQNGYEIISNQDWETHNRIMIGKDGHSFPLQIEKSYFYPFVIRLCKDLEIEPPADHVKCCEQYKAYLASRKKEQKEKEEGE